VFGRADEQGAARGRTNERMRRTGADAGGLFVFARCVVRSLYRMRCTELYGMRADWLRCAALRGLCIEILPSMLLVDGWAEGEGLGMDVRGSKGFEFVGRGEGEGWLARFNLIAFGD